jgi:hypothetical protein
VAEGLAHWHRGMSRDKRNKKGRGRSKVRVSRFLVCFLILARSFPALSPLAYDAEMFVSPDF